MRSKMAQPRLRTALMAVTLVCLCLTASAQKTQQEPATDSSAQASPIKPSPSTSVDDSSSQASPITPVRLGSGVSIAPHTALRLRLTNPIDSGRLKNGQTVHATLAAAVSLSPRGTLPAGTPVNLTVVETLPAGRIYAVGEFSLQMLRAGSVPVFTDTLTFRGKPGHKDLPDSAPAVGTDAGLAAGAALTFHVQPPPSPDAKPLKNATKGPGAVDGVASGSPPPPGTSPASQRQGSGNAKGTQARQVTPANNTPQPAQNLGKTSPAPNQPAPPQNATPTDATQPR